MTVGTRIGSVGGSQGPATIFPYNMEAIAKSDSTTFDSPVAVVVYGAGDIVFRPRGGNANITLTITAAMLPYTLPVMVDKVMSTSTTATAMYGIW